MARVNERGDRASERRDRASVQEIAPRAKVRPPFEGCASLRSGRPFEGWRGMTQGRGRTSEEIAPASEGCRHPSKGCACHSLIRGRPFDRVAAPFAHSPAPFAHSPASEARSRIPTLVPRTTQRPRPGTHIAPARPFDLGRCSRPKASVRCSLPRTSGTGSSKKPARTDHGRRERARVASGAGPSRRRLRREGRAGASERRDRGPHGRERSRERQGRAHGVGDGAAPQGAGPLRTGAPSASPWRWPP